MPRLTVEPVLDAMAQPLWVLRADAAIDHANVRARALMSVSPWFAAPSGRVRAVGDVDAQALGPLLAAREATQCAIAYPEAGRLRRATLRTTPVRGIAPYAAAWPHAVAVMTLELAGELDPARWIARLAAHHRLTPAEHRVLEQVAAGATLAEVAARQHVAPATVRTHLRSLFNKTGARRQAELVRLALS